MEREGVEAHNVRREGTCTVMQAIVERPVRRPLVVYKTLARVPAPGSKES